MPNDQQVYTQYQGTIWLKQYRKDGNLPSCPWCGGLEWYVGDELMSIPAMVKGRGRMAASVPALGCFCTKCGYLMAFSAVVAGFILANPPVVASV